MIDRNARGARWGRVVTLLGLGVALGGTVSSTLHAQDSPRAVVQETADQVVNVLQDKNLSTEQKRRKIEEIVYTRFDFVTIGRLVLARNWKELTPDQQQEFINEFKKHLSVTYGKSIETYNGEKVTIVSDRAEAIGDWTVKTKILRPNAAPVLVDYRLRQVSGRWHVVDVIIEGVSLVANYRSQFQDIMASGGTDKLLQVLRERNAKGQPLKTT